jgi:hypothetical protein
MQPARHGPIFGCVNKGNQMGTKMMVLVAQGQVAKLAMVVAALGLSACAATYDVAKLGPDTYTVSSAASPARGGASGARSLALARAAEYCQQMAREVMVINMAGQTTNIHGAGSADVSFRCLTANDPQLVRPSYERSPDVIVQHR